MGRLKDLKDTRRARRGSGAKKAGVGCLGCFGILWLAFVLGFDGYFAYGFWRAYDARTRYSAAAGTVTAADIESHSDSDGGTTYSAKVVYDYEVGGRAYTGDRHSFFGFSSSSHKRAQAIVDRYRVGSRVTVHYDPDEPGESVLETDASSFPPIVILFMTPFHCIGIAFVTGGVLSALRKRRGEDAPVAAYIVREDKERMVLEDAHLPGWAVFWGTLGVCSFVMIFVLGLALGMDGSRSAVLWTWGGCVGMAILLPTMLRVRRAHRDRRLTIDWLTGRFTRRPGSVGVSIADIRTIRQYTERTNTKVNNRPWYRHTLSGIDEAGAEHTLLVVKGFWGAGEGVRDWFARRFEAAAVSEVDEDMGGGEPDAPVLSEVPINRGNGRTNS